jgi:plasmid stabilization system protein ParE
LAFELSPEATRDVAAILEESRREYGKLAAFRMKQRLDQKFTDIALGIAKGHTRWDLATAIPLRFEVARPFVVAFDPETRRIVRVVHGSRDFPALFASD